MKNETFQSFILSRPGNITIRMKAVIFLILIAVVAVWHCTNATTLQGFFEPQVGKKQESVAKLVSEKWYQGGYSLCAVS